MPPLSRLAALLAAFFLVGGAGPAAAANASKLSAYETGRPAAGLPCDTQPKRTAVLMGGGIDVKAAYTWMINRIYQCSTSSLGNFVVIRARGNPDYDRFIYKLGPLASVQTLVIPTRETADDPALDPYIRNAAAIWITGGDQADYYNRWKGTRLERLVHDQVRTHAIPIGGTSAGMMILSEFNYLADPDTITSAEALADPYKPGAVTLARDFWTFNDPAREATPFPFLADTITDSHLDARDRMGRLITFMARTIADGWVARQDARAIGVDQETALLVETDAIDPRSYSATTVANPGIAGAAYFLAPTKTSDLAVVPGAFTFTNIQVRKLPAGTPAVTYQLSVDRGILKASGNGGSIY